MQRTTRFRTHQMSFAFSFPHSLSLMSHPHSWPAFSSFCRAREAGGGNAALHCDTANVCLANTLIISTRANRIDNYTLYTEALPHFLCLPIIPSHCFFHWVPSPRFSPSVFLKPIVFGIYFCEHHGVFFPLVIDINEVLAECVRPAIVCLWRRAKNTIEQL